MRATCISTPQSGRVAYRRLADISRTKTGRVLALAIGLFFAGAVATAFAAGVVTAPGVPGEQAVPPKSSGKAAIVNPSWKELSAPQQQALSPLATEWDKLDAPHKSKWLEISRRYVTMKPDDQSRMQERMRAWVALTPEQRRVARESYARTKKLNNDQKSAQWQQYQELPEDQKKTLAAEAGKNKVAALPSVHSKPKTVAPIKSASKPILQQSVSPKSAAAPVTPTVSPSASSAVPATTAPALPATVVPAPPVAAGAAPAEH
ncbi:MAG: DUF3106 domain-containing protein [Herminiimonas sp.]|nr:DUF3106 domain-containing protein [Herminiimonas sp.]